MEWFVVFCFIFAALVAVNECITSYTPRQYYWWLQRQQRHRHLHGPHVCAVETLPFSGVQLYTDCSKWTLPKTMCGHRVKVAYECCVGFKQLKGQQGCQAVSRLENLIVTLRQVGAQWMSKNALATGLHKLVSKDTAMTVFAPSDATTAKASLPSKLLHNKYVARDDSKKASKKPVRRPVMEYHVLRGRHRLTDLGHNALYSPARGGGNIRVTRYNNGMVAVNCARILSANHEATDGIVHVIDGVLSPPEMRSVADLLLTDHRVSQFSGLLKKTGILSRLRRRQPLTVFAPIDKAFNKLSSAAFSHVLRDKNLLKALMRYHIVEDTWCTAGVTVSHQVATMEGSQINMTCTGQELIKVNDAMIIKSDIVASNGVIHIIDDIVFPSKARELWSLLSTMGFTKLVYFMTKAGLNSTLVHNKQATLLAPTNAAFNALPDNIAKRFQNDVAFLRRVLLYHIIAGRQHVTSLTAGSALKTFEASRARVNVYPWCIAVESACLTNNPVSGLNGIIHIINSIIIPPEVTVAEVIDKHAKFTILRESLQASGLVTVFQREGAFTFLAPTDRAFQSLPSSTRDVLLRNPTHIAKILRYHIVGDIHVSCSIKRNLVYPLVTLLGSEIHVRRQGEHLMVEDAILLEKDIMATNGVVHVIDKVLLPDKEPL